MYSWRKRATTPRGRSGLALIKLGKVHIHPCLHCVLSVSTVPEHGGSSSLFAQKTTPVDAHIAFNPENTPVLQ
jgi:hypothetical protein